VVTRVGYPKAASDTTGHGPMPLPRFRLRSLMIAVAVAAVVALAGRLLSLSVAYRHRARAYWWMAPTLIAMGPASRPSPRPSAHNLWARQMAAKYERAARYPWLPVPPDPPAPE
jgi:hypothetical protein